jgi:hypothetical protein
MSTLLSQLPHLLQGLTFFGIMGSVALAFEWADGGLSQESRAKLSLWLRSVPGAAQIDAWASVFPNLIDRVFGKKALSFKFFLRSCIASIAAVVIAEALSIAVLGRNALTSGNGWMAYETLAYYLWLALPINCVPDYFSLLFSRFIVRQMAKRPTKVRVFVLLTVDSVVSVAIAIAAIGMIAPYLYVFGTVGASDVYAQGFREEVSLFVFTLASYVRALMGPGGWGPFLRLYLFASMFTSVWVWLYVAASVATRIINSARVMWVKVLPFLSIEDRPMQAIGRVAGILAALAYLAILGGIWLLQHA